MARRQDTERISLVTATSWKTTYRGMIDDTYLDDLKEDHWVQFLISAFDDDGQLSEGRLCMVLLLDEQIVASAVLAQAEKATEIHLTALYMLPECIGQGYGRQLYEAVEKEIKNRGYTECSLDVLQSNSRAICFYQSAGFVKTGGQTVFTLGEREYTSLAMRKSLSWGSL